MRVFAFILIGCCSVAHAQQIDSVHVFDALSSGQHTSASANALAWRLHRDNAHHTTLKGPEIGKVREAMALYRKAPHRSGELPDLKHLAMVFSNGRPTAMGVTEDLDRFINFTARTEYHIDSFSDHLLVRAKLLELLMDH